MLSFSARRPIGDAAFAPSRFPVEKVMSMIDLILTLESVSESGVFHVICNKFVMVKALFLCDEPEVLMWLESG